jgi:hypothetical protein
MRWPTRRWLTRLIELPSHQISIFAQGGGAEDTKAINFVSITPALPWHQPP